VGGDLADDDVEGGLTRDHRVVDARDLGGLGRDGDARMHEPERRALEPTVAETGRADLDDPVGFGIEAGGLEVEHHEGLLGPDGVGREPMRHARDARRCAAHAVRDAGVMTTRGEAAAHIRRGTHHDAR
jgi:hypothetical protein